MQSPPPAPRPVAATPRPTPGPRHVVAGALAIAALLGAAAAARAADAERAPATDPPAIFFDVLYDVRVVPTRRIAEVALFVGEHGGNVHELDFDLDPERHMDLKADGELAVEDGRARWVPPRGGGALRYTFLIDDLRDELRFDARCAEDWAVFRGDDLVPPVRTRVESGTRSRARLRFRLPNDWSAAVPYPRTDDGSYAIVHDDRIFDRPVGWMVVGKLGVVRERVAGTHVGVAGPVGHGVHRLDILALLRWTMPTVRELVGRLPERILVVSAGDPMWRGGLSGPHSAFIHADRPLISNDGTSPLLHEVMHILVPIHGDEGADWVVEGLAEYYSLEVLKRSRTLSRKRHARALRRLAARGRDVKSLRVERAHGAITARAVTLLQEIDARIQKESDGARSLDDVVRALVREPGTLTHDRFRQITERIAGVDLSSIFDRRIFRDAPKAAAE